MLNRLTPTALAAALLAAGCAAPTVPTLTAGSAAFAPANLAPRLASVATTATGSATTGTYVAARAVDGDTNTEWQAPGSPAPTLTIDRGFDGALSAIAIKAKPAQPFSLLVSDNGTTFRSVYTGSTGSWSLEPKALAAGTTARYVRVAYQAASAPVMVFELQPVAAAGVPGAPTTAPTVVPTTAPSAAPTAAPVGGAIATRFGNQSVPKAADGTLTKGYQLMSELGMSSIREGWNWKNIETGDRTYVSWMNWFDDVANHFVAAGQKTQAMVCDTPAWASSNGTQYGVPNGLAAAIFADGTDVYKPGVGPNTANKFATFMFDQATRFKGKIAYWQVWNEPDFPSGDLGAGTVGANGNTRYWDGSVQDYVRLLKVASTVVKGIDPAAKITLGGLGYEGYLGAILDNGGAPYFDVVDFHAYGTDKTSSNGVLNTSWGFLGRYNALKGVLQAHGLSRPFSCSETGFTSTNQPEQANYVAKVLTTGLGLGDMALVQWAVFTNPGFNSIGLVDGPTLSLKTQGYTAYAAATHSLAGCVPTGAVTGTNVQGYAFRRPDGKTLWVAWSTASSASLALSFKPTQVLNVQGQPQTLPTGGSLALTTSPLYIVN